MNRSWRSLAILLLAAVAVWFVTGPMQAMRSERKPASSSNRNSGQTSRSPSTSHSPARGQNDVFDAVDRAVATYRSHRADSGSSTSGRARPSADRSRTGGAESAARGVTAPRAELLPAEGRIMLVLDASGSMARRAPDGRTSMAMAQEAMAGALHRLPEGTPVGLRVFGSTVDGHGQPTRAACRDTRLVAPIAPLNRAKMTNAVRSFRPLGETPIAASLRAAVRDLGSDGPRSILLVSDGEESCEPDPCRAVSAARAQGVNVRINTVGLRVGTRARSQLQCIAAQTNGVYAEAATESELADTLQNALDQLRPQRDGQSLQAAAAVSAAEPTAGRFSLGEKGFAAALAFLVVFVAFYKASKRG